MNDAVRQQRFAAGKVVLDAIDGEAGDRVIQALGDISPELAHQVVAYGFGDIYARPQLAPQQRQLVTLGMLTALGGCEAQLEVHINASLNVGLTPAEIVEALLHSAVYAGFPRALNATFVAKKVFAERDLLPIAGDAAVPMSAVGHSDNPVSRFFAALAAGDVDGAVAATHQDAVFEAQGPAEVPIYGTFRGTEGIRDFVGILGELFDTEAFEIRALVSDENVVMAHGYLQHLVRATGKQFACEWALICEVQDDRITSYKMFEDTAALAAAYG